MKLEGLIHLKYYVYCSVLFIQEVLSNTYIYIYTYIYTTSCKPHVFSKPLQNTLNYTKLKKCFLFVHRTIMHVTYLLTANVYS